LALSSHILVRFGSIPNSTATSVRLFVAHARARITMNWMLLIAAVHLRAFIIPAKFGTAIAITRTMIAITASSSISVNPD